MHRNGNISLWHRAKHARIPLTAQSARKFVAKPKSNWKSFYRYPYERRYSPDASENDVARLGGPTNPVSASHPHTNAWVYVRRWQRIAPDDCVRRPFKVGPGGLEFARKGKRDAPLPKVQAKCVRENQSCTEWGDWKTRWTVSDFRHRYVPGLRMRAF